MRKILPVIALIAVIASASAGCIFGKQVRITFGGIDTPTIDVIDGEFDTTTVDPSTGLPDTLPQIEEIRGNE